MKSISVKLPTLAKLAEAFNDITVVSGGTGTYVSFGNESSIDLKDLDKTISLTFSSGDDWTWCVTPDESSYTGIDTDDLRTLFPKRRFKSPRRHVRVGCNSIRIDDNLDIIVGINDHKCTENEIAEIEELLATRREMMK